MDPDFCCLCGISVAGPRKRFCNSETFPAFIRDKCKATPFAYAFLASNADSSSRYTVCIPCVNWKRRVETAGLKRYGRPYLQLDALILYLLQPGKMPEPDHRCMKRLMRAARTSDNPFRRCFPLPVKTILSMTKGDTYVHAISAWWEYNGRTQFFRSPQEARRVRCAIKTGIVQEED